MILLSDSLADPLSSLKLIERRLLVRGPDRPRSSPSSPGYLRRLGAREAHPAARAGGRADRGRPLRRAGRRHAATTSSESWPTRSSACAGGSRKLDRARSEFIANASHELRTPLFSLGGFLELMADEELDEETRQEFLETMREQVDRLAKLATDLLDLSRLDAGRMHVEHEPVDLGEVARVVSAEFGALAERRKHVGRDRGRRAARSRAPTSCACSRSCGRCSTTRSRTRRRGRA